MFMKWFISENIVTSIITFVTLAVSVSLFVMILRRRHSEPLRRLASFIDSLPLLAGLIPMAGFLTNIYSFYRAISSVASNGAGDPRVVAYGFQEFFFYLTVSGGFYFIFLEVWLVLQMIYVHFLYKLETNSK